MWRSPHGSNAQCSLCILLAFYHLPSVIEKMNRFTHTVPRYMEVTLVRNKAGWFVGFVYFEWALFGVAWFQFVL